MWFLILVLLILSFAGFTEDEVFYGIIFLIPAIILLVDKTLNKRKNTPAQTSRSQQQSQQPQPEISTNSNNTSSVQRAAFCPLCGEKVKKEALFCGSCGTKLPSSQEYYIDVFCPYCHEKLSYTNWQIKEGELTCPMCDAQFELTDSEYQL